MKKANTSRFILFSWIVFICGYLLVGLECIERLPLYSSSRPHIVVIIADDLGWNDVSFHGADQIPTPNIDALAYNGVILQRHYVLPTCTPSRTAFLTGRYPIREGMQSFPLRTGEQRAIPKERKLLPEYLKDLGYSTHLVGKWHVGYYAPQYTPTKRGFDTFFGYYNGYVDYLNHTVSEDPESHAHIGNDLHRDKLEKLSPEFATGYLTDLITEEAEKTISMHNPARPLYLQVAHLAAHATGIDGEELQVRDSDDLNLTFGYIKDIKRRAYAGVVAALDESVGRIADALRKADMLKNSIILFMSDNGAQTEGLLQNYGSNYPLRGLKFTMYEGGVRGVACIYSPLIRKTSTVSDQLIHITDWLPTLYSAARGNARRLKNLDGVDQWDAIRSGKSSIRDRLLVNIDDDVGEESAIIGRYKLVKRTNTNYGNFYGDDGEDDSYPKYEPSDVRSSLAASAISTVSSGWLREGKITKLRRSSKVSCQRSTHFANCTESCCLFDIYADPCETVDISALYPKIVADLRNYVNGYRKVVVNQTNYSVEPASYPENFDGTWMPWLKDEDYFEDDDDDYNVAYQI
ncbi:hypothetical protein KPH14_011215 [Odynerus spinipes]|uniref:Sulfatase N-terminal domain-containing protein n=1 Tax=Odynerus spinipes TaxID=1348599 RepID=A0AAD9R951_9HYME|nr:hypothetical protein KPH14_011215 [Odynerus spinipes]